MIDKIRTWKELRSEIHKARQARKKIVTTNGCFDNLHIGHIRCLQQAKQKGDILIVAINNDDSVRAIKGDGRPLVSENERAEMLAALECVDYVTIFAEQSSIPLLKMLRPDVHVKGGDYALDQIPEREVVESFGGELCLVAFTQDRSTTGFIEQVLDCFLRLM